MDNKTKALLREELSVGGAIAGTVLATGLMYILVQVVMARAGYLYSNVVDAVLGIGVIVPLATALLLVLNVANTGHLSGGFSRRILRLPVSTRTAVTVVLFTRLLLVAVTALVLAGLGWVFYERGTGLQSILIILGIFLCVQLIDWTFVVTGRLVMGVAAAVLAGILYATDGFKAVFWFLASTSNTSLGAVAVFTLFSAAAYALALHVVERIRTGDAIAIPWQIPLDRPRLALQRTRAFGSPFWAQVWYERRRAGLFFPVVFLSVWLLCVAVHVLTVLNHRWGSPEAKMQHLMDPFWPFQTLPLIALVLAAIAWGIRTAVRQDASGRMTFDMRLPLRREQFALARLMSSALTLGPWLALVAVLYGGAFLFGGEQNIFFWLFSSALADGSAGLIQIANVLLAPALAAGFLAWFCMTCEFKLRGQHFSFIIAIPVLVLIGVGFYYLQAEGSEGGHLFSHVLAILLLAVILAPLASFAYLLWTAVRRGAMTRRAAAFCLVLWAAAAGALAPYSFLDGHRIDAFLILVALAGGAALVLPYPALILQFGRTQPGDWVVAENPAQFARDRRGPARWLAPVLVLAALLGVGLFRWTAYAQWKEHRRDQGLPITLAELDSFYGVVPAAENLATRYLEAHKALKPLPSGSLAPYEGSDVSRCEPLTPEQLRDARAAQQQFAPAIQALREAAQSGLTQGHYPVDFSKGMRCELPHLAQLRQLARVLCLSALMQAMDGNTKVAVDDILAILPIARSLENEPVVVSQYVRFAIVGLALSVTEDIMNRVVLPDDELLRLQKGLADVIAPESVSMIEKARIGEDTIGIDFARNMEFLFDYKPDQSLLQELVGGALGLAADQFGYMPQLLFLAGNRQLNSDKCVAEAMERMPDSGRIGYFMMGYSWHRPEHDIRTRVALARTAIAVERYRLAKNHLPERLDELVPEFLDAIAPDYFADGRPISYRIKDNGEFVVWSWGRDGDDDRGEEDSEHQDHNIVDYTFTVPPPGRATPPVAREL